MEKERGGEELKKKTNHGNAVTKYDVKFVGGKFRRPEGGDFFFAVFWSKFAARRVRFLGYILGRKI